MMKKLGIGIIGCGRHARTGHLPFFAANPNSKLIAVCSRKIGNAKRTAKQWKAEAYYTDYRDLLKRVDIQAVSICNPVWLHKETVLAAADAGKHILCEKPMAVTSSEAYEMVRIAARNKVILMVGFSHRFYELNRRLKQMILSGKLGRLIMFHNRFNLDVNYEKTWFAEKKRSGGGVVMDCGVHSIDLFRWLAGEVREVSAFTGTFVQRMAVEDTAVLLLKAANGMPGVVELSWSTPASVNTVEIYGSKGTAVVDYGRNEIRVKCGNKKWMARKNVAPYVKQTFKSEIDHFLACVLAGQTPSVTGHDGLASLRIVEAVYASAKQGKVMTVK